MTVETDEAGNTWATAPGDSDRFVIIGGHLDSVPNGGWLDGALNVVGGLEVLRALAPEPRAAHAQAGRLGRRGGRALRPQPARLERLRRHARPRRRARPDRPRRHRAAGRARRARRRARPHARVAARGSRAPLAYLELHIEQGPVLEQLDLPLGVVLGTFGVAAPPGPLHRRARARGRDARWTCAATRSSPRRAARSPCATTPRARDDVRATTGIVQRLARDRDRVQRHLRDLARPARARRRRARRHARHGAGASAERIAAEEGCEVEWERVWEIEPIPFDAGADRPRRRGGRGGRRARATACRAARCTTRRRWRA